MKKCIYLVISLISLFLAAACSSDSDEQHISNYTTNYDAITEALKANEWVSVRDGDSLVVNIHRSMRNKFTYEWYKKEKSGYRIHRREYFESCFVKRTDSGDFFFQLVNFVSPTISGNKIKDKEYDFTFNIERKLLVISNLKGDKEDVRLDPKIAEYPKVVENLNLNRTLIHVDGNDSVSVKLSYKSISHKHYSRKDGKLISENTFDDVDFRIRYDSPTKISGYYMQVFVGKQPQQIFDYKIDGELVTINNFPKDNMQTKGFMEFLGMEKLDHALVQGEWIKELSHERIYLVFENKTLSKYVYASATGQLISSNNYGYYSLTYRNRRYSNIVSAETWILEANSLGTYLSYKIDGNSLILKGDAILSGVYTKK